MVFEAKVMQKIVAGAVCLFMQMTAHAQLNENCTVSVLNRNAQVDANGNWRIDNVPVLTGPVVATATCTNNGMTKYGQSTPVVLTASSITGFDGSIALTGTPPPIPAFLA